MPRREPPRHLRAVCPATCCATTAKPNELCCRSPSRRVVLLQVSSRWRPIDSLVPVYPATPLRGHKTTVRREWHPDPLADLPTAAGRRQGAPVTPAKHHSATEPLLLVHWKSALIPEWNRHDVAMSPAHTTKNGTKRYRYYVCSAAQKKGWHSCTTKSVPAGEMERFVVSQIRGLTSDRDFVEETVAACLSQQQTKIVALQGERRSLERDLELWQSEISRVLESGDTSTTTAQRIAVYEGRLRETSQQLQNLAEQHSSLKASIEANALKRALADFDEVWKCDAQSAPEADPSTTNPTD